MDKTWPTEVIGGVTFELRTRGRASDVPGNICVRKLPRILDNYKRLAPDFQGCRMVELGVDRGGGTALFTKLFNPSTLMACELSRAPVQGLLQFLAEHDTDGNVQVNWGVDQSDTPTLSRLVDACFGDQPVDLVVDDASHLLEPTTRSFEVLFPRLRPGGVFIIEDWGSEHMIERHMQDAMESEPEGATAQAVAALPEGTERPLPLSLLICQLTVAASYRPEWISEVRTFRGYCEILRGEGEIAPGTPVGRYMGPAGEWLLGER